MPPTILLSCESISKSYGVKPLFADLSIGLAEGDHVGLVGPNGSGKSTLLKIMAGFEEPDEGTKSMRRQLRIGYVPQDQSFDGAHTIEEVLAQVLIDEGLDPHDHSDRMSAALSLGEFPATDQSTATLSGGWKKRLAIVRSLMLEPDVLLMDEPTNHLDIEGILWLERLLRAEARAFLVVSHDRRFLEAVTSRMIEINRSYPTGVFESKGNYSDFLEQRDAALRAQANYEASLANRVRREVEWLRRSPKARTTKAKSRIDSAGRLIEELNSADARKDQGTAGINFTSSGRRSKQLVEATQLCKSLGGRQIVKNLDLLLGPGQRLGLLGPNGSGKSTLLKLVAGTLEPDAGTITRADKLRVVTFEQHRESLDQSSSLRRALAPHGDAVVYQDRSVHLVSWAKRFLFRPEQLDLPVSRLSGGEQARLLIARPMALRPRLHHAARAGRHRTDRMVRRLCAMGVCARTQGGGTDSCLDVTALQASPRRIGINSKDKTNRPVLSGAKGVGEDGGKNSPSRGDHCCLSGRCGRPHRRLQCGGVTREIQGAGRSPHSRGAAL